MVEFRDKSDIRKIPEIPKKLAVEMQSLLRNTINNKTLPNFNKLEAVYKYLDKYNDFVATFSVCQKACSHCCKNDVLLSQLEAEYITYKGGPQFDKGNTFTQAHFLEACPFLKESGLCSIYENRPFNCRTLHALDDPKYCANPAEEHQLYGSSGNGYGVNIYSTLATWLKSLHQPRGLPYRDIRDWFPVQSEKPTWMARFFAKICR